MSTQQVIEKDKGILAAADVFTESTTLQVSSPSGWTSATARGLQP